jgi:hypothetical protein
MKQDGKKKGISIVGMAIVIGKIPFSATRCNIVLIRPWAKNISSSAVHDARVQNIHTKTMASQIINSIAFQ